MRTQQARDSSSTTWTGTEVHMFQDIQTALDGRAEDAGNISPLTTESDSLQVAVRRRVLDKEALLR